VGLDTLARLDSQVRLDRLVPKVWSVPGDQMDATAVPVLPDFLERRDLQDLRAVLELLDYVATLVKLDLRE